MCLGSGGGGGASDSLNYQKAQERKRQKRIDRGMSRVDAIFEGGNFGVNKAGGNVGTDQKLFNAGGGVFHNPNGSKQRSDARIEKAAEAGNVFKDRRVTEGFDDSFFEERKQAYLDQANPQLERQAEEAKADLTFALSDAGTLESGVGASEFADFQEEQNRARQNIGDKAQDAANQARQQLADERSRLTRLAQSTADPSAISSQAQNVSSNLRAEAQFDPLPKVFQDTAANIGAFGQGRRAGQQSKRVSDLFRGPSEGSGRIIGG